MAKGRQEPVQEKLSILQSFRRECQFKRGTDLAKYIATKLAFVRSSLTLSHDGRKVTASDAAKELYEYDLGIIGDSIDLIAKLDNEQFRQREAIKLYLHGQIDRNELRRISETWNGEKN